MDPAPNDSPVPDLDMIAAARREIDAIRDSGSDVTLKAPPLAPDDSHSLPPDSVTGYQILKEVHRGGQGIVYQAIQRSTNRKVAIKVMKEGPFAGPGDKARFEREVQVLGQLKHPNIVTIHDSGMAAGCHYFVMDYISGQPLDVWIAGGQRSIPETLKLFGQICDAVTAAHLRGIIHRDLKPSNIRIDENNQPHVLDFGLAKVAASEMHESAMTITGQFIGSLPWASPEQAEGHPGKIDLRTDVYSLGVILYQMLTGKFPYDVIGPMRDVLDRIIKSQPVKPRTIRRQIDDEVETITLKCLSKDRDRRYQTAGELARDVQRYLKGEPIEAKRDSVGYMLRKQLRRYRVVAAVTAGFAIVTMAALFVCLGALGNANRARAEEEKQRQLAQVNAQLAHEARQRADDRADTLRRHLYVSNLGYAFTAFDASNIARVRSLLDACPEDLRNWEWDYMNWRSRESVRTIDGSGRVIASGTVSSDFKLIATGGINGDLTLWDAEPFRERWTRPVLGASSSTRAVFSADGTRILAWGLRSRPRLVDTATGDVIATCTECDWTTGEAELLPKGRGALFVRANRMPDHVVGVGDIPDLFTSYFDRPDDSSIVEVWNPDTRSLRLVRRIPSKSPGGAKFAIHPDGRRLAWASNENTIHIMDIDSAEELLTLTGHTDVVQNLLFNRDGTQLVSFSDDKTFRLWDCENGKELRRISDPLLRNVHLAFRPDGHVLATSTGRAVDLWNLRTGEHLRTLRGHSGDVQFVKFAPDGRRLLSADNDRIALLWNVSIDREMFVAPSTPGGVDSIQFTPDGRNMLTVHAPNNVFLADGQSGRRPRQVAYCGKCAVLSPDGSVIAYDSAGDSSYMASESRCIEFIDIVTGRRVRDPMPFRSVPAMFAFAPDGKQLVVAGATTLPFARSKVMGETTHGGKFAMSGDQTPVRAASIRIYDTTTGQCIKSAGGHDDAVLRASFSPDGRWLVSVGRDNVIKLWNADTLTEVHTLTRNGVPSTVAAFSPDSTLVAAGCMDAGRVWEVQTGRERHILRGHARVICGVGFSPDGTRIVTGGADDTVKLWDVRSGSEVLSLSCPRLMTVSTRFTPNGAHIVAGTLDGNVVFWDRMPSTAEQTHQRWITQEAFRRVDQVRTTNANIERAVLAWHGESSADSEVADEATDMAAIARADRLSQRAWKIVENSGAELSRLESAVKDAETACRLVPAIGHFSGILGIAYYRCGRDDDAIKTLQRANTLFHHALNDAYLALALHRSGRSAEARRYMVRLWAVLRAEAWKGDESVQAAAREAEEVITGRAAAWSFFLTDGREAAAAVQNWQTVASATGSETDWYVIECGHYLAHSLDRTGDAEHADSEFRKALERVRMKASESKRAEYLDCYLEFLVRSNRPEPIISLRQEAVEIARRAYGKKGRALAEQLLYLGEALAARGRIDEARQALNEAINVIVAVWGEGHAETVGLLNRAGVCWLNCGETEAAVLLFERARRESARRLGDLHEQSLVSMVNCAWALRTKNDFAGSETLYRSVLAIRRRILPATSEAVRMSIGQLAQHLCESGQFDEAELLAREALDLCRKGQPPSPIELASRQATLGMILLGRKNYDEAEPLIRESLTFRKRAFPPGHPDHWLQHNARSLLGEALVGLHRFQEAEAFIVEAANSLRPPPPFVYRQREAIERAVKLYQAWDEAEPKSGKAGKADEWRKRLRSQAGTASQP